MANTRQRDRVYVYHPVARAGAWLLLGFWCGVVGTSLCAVLY